MHHSRDGLAGREGRPRPLPVQRVGRAMGDRSFDVLYTSLDRDGAIAEMYFQLLRGQPVFPSKVRYTLNELRVELSETLHLQTLPDLAALGLDPSRYGQLSHVERIQEYTRTQEIAEVAHFLDCDGLVVPSARWTCTNLVLFCDRLGPNAIEVVKDHSIIDWTSWQKATKVQL